MRLNTHYHRISLDCLTSPEQGDRVIKDSWWVVCEMDGVDYAFGYSQVNIPHHVTSHHFAPQSNASEGISKYLCPEGCRVVYLPVAFWSEAVANFQGVQPDMLATLYPNNYYVGA